MAKKKNTENTLQYLQMPLPQGGKYGKMTKVAFGGLNKRYTMDSGELTKEINISSNEYPYLVPSMKPKEILSGYYNEDESEGKKRRIPISMFGFEDFILVFYRNGDRLLIDRIPTKRSTIIESDISTGLVEIFGSSNGDELLRAEENIPRSIVQFNKYIQSNDIVNGEYKKHLLIFPDKKSMYFDIDDLLNDENAPSGYDFGTTDMSVDIQEYYNDKAEVDYSGAIIYPPPDTLSHNGYYRNTAKIQGTNFGTDIYRWTNYDAARLKKDENGEDAEIGLEENGKYEDGTPKYKTTGFELDENGNYIFDGDRARGWKVCVPPTMPNIKYATVHLSRLFGLSDDCVYASGFNDYTNWNLDTASEYNESNAWQSKAQSNTKAGGNFTGITNFQGHVVCFKRDYMHEIYNTKNPFRIQDIYAEGTIDNRTIQDVDGKLIFVSEDDVKIYTGSNPRVISYNLNMSQYTYAVSGTDNRNYYLYCEDKEGNMYLYVYDTYTDMWSEQECTTRVLNFAHNIHGMYMLCEDGSVYKMDTNDYKHEWGFETDIITNKTVDIKHIKKLQMLAEVSDDANMKVYILYDDEEFDKLENKDARLVYSSNKHGRLPIRVKPRKTANYGFKLHIEGTGYVKLYELEIFVEQGGDMYV